MARLPFVNYLRLGDPPVLVVQACKACGARFFDRRNACASCGSDAGFDQVEVAREGVVRTFTIVSFAAPGVPVPYVSGIVDCEGTTVRGNIVNIAADPEHVHAGMKVRLTILSLGTDAAGTNAVGYGFEPIESGAA
ncbi:OB-fold domain-containing protein [Frankia sp. AgB1.9]|uniref:Zn-ribbon domain-containing OB-fold protein n=1 Tax=unclassified Frankia TaxID=2632575 RepID=UPI00193376DD|nr:MULTISPECIES: OB-fold domain-containing protein [unclassified Frankia]MBL7487574.1 OB-fold domain-containing protein [Frankia sp. AgW1.1]MBL7548962.1 OB-fold domain-containing protein [Frankia sp. AgB1.9]MBL7620665.1 OB-fold domain-containing protein [Frankia sp. AgB1.8]